MFVLIWSKLVRSLLGWFPHRQQNLMSPLKPLNLKVSSIQLFSYNILAVTHFQVQGQVDYFSFDIKMYFSTNPNAGEKFCPGCLLMEWTIDQNLRRGLNLLWFLTPYKINCRNANALKWIPSEISVLLLCQFNQTKQYLCTGFGEAESAGFVWRPFSETLIEQSLWKRDWILYPICRFRH